MNKTLTLGSTIGIVGAGQLGKMMAQSAQKYGYKVATYDPNPAACAFPLSNWHQVGSFDDSLALQEFARKVDVLTYEFENINASILATLEQQVNFPQGTLLLLKSQDRIQEKQWLNEIGVPTTEYWSVSQWDELKAALQKSSFPAILKTTRFGYDGKGQIKIGSFAEMDQQREDIEQMLSIPCVLEAFCPFIAEISVIVARDQSGTSAVFPLSQNVHHEGILFTSSAPAKVEASIEGKIKLYAEKIAALGQLVGVMGIEFFLLADGSLVVNELAPRPHNTGHYTMEACNVSQFDQHILAIVGRQLSPIIQFKPALMINLLGQDLPLVPHFVEQFPHVSLHLYQKGEASHNRKMGHLTVLQDDVNDFATLIDLVERHRNAL